MFQNVFKSSQLLVYSYGKCYTKYEEGIYTNYSEVYVIANLGCLFDYIWNKL